MRNAMNLFQSRPIMYLSDLIIKSDPVTEHARVCDPTWCEMRLSTVASCCLRIPSLSKMLSWSSAASTSDPDRDCVEMGVIRIWVRDTNCWKLSLAKWHAQIYIKHEVYLTIYMYVNIDCSEKVYWINKKRTGSIPDAKMMRELMTKVFQKVVNW